jgi:hypothetical protein
MERGLYENPWVVEHEELVANDEELIINELEHFAVLELLVFHLNY